MKFLAITRRRIESFGEAEFTEALAAEADAAREAYARGDFRELYSRGDVPGAVLVIEAADIEGAWALIEDLPLFQRGMMDVEVIPLRPYRGFV
jgi:muconolactone delta-isomerase